MSVRLRTNWIIILISFLSFSSCKREGCTDSLALNYEEGKNKDDGSCVYGTVLFYTTNDSYFNSGSTEELVEKPFLTVNGKFVDSLHGARNIIPVNCDEELTIAYDFVNSKSIEWTIHLQAKSGEVLNKSGTLSPNDRFCFVQGFD